VTGTAAGDEFRTYMIMLLVGAPVLIDAKVSRNFLEQAQSLGGEMARALAATARTPGQVSYPTARLDDAVQRLRTASTPLLQVLDPETRLVIRGDQPADLGLARPIWPSGPAARAAICEELSRPNRRVADTPVKSTAREHGAG
jgi:hypothetical protein